MIRAVAIGLAVWVSAKRMCLAKPELVASTAGVMVVAPLAGFGLAAMLVARTRWSAAASLASEARRDEQEATLFAELVSLGLTAGLSLRAAVTEARSHLVGKLGDDLDALMLDMDRVGVATALAGVEGTLTDFGRAVAGAAASGAPVASAVAAHADTRRQIDHSERVAAARRLPVRLLLPLALLILPGFVVLAVGPALLQALARLGPVP